MLFMVGVVVSEGSEMMIDVGDAEPTIDNIVIDGQDIGAVVTPNIGTTKEITVEVEVSDFNGYEDVQSVECKIPARKDGEEILLALSEAIDIETANFAGSFEMEFYERPKEDYQINCSVLILKDGSSITVDMVTEYFKYDSLTALDLDADNIVFESADPGETVTLNGDNNMTTISAPTIQNLGNVVIDAEISGQDFVSGEEIIAVDNVQYQFGSLGFKTLNTTAQVEAGLNLARGISSTTNLDFKLYIPIGTPSASFSGDVTISAVEG